MLTRLDDLVRRGDPERPAVTFKDGTLTYGRLAEQVGAAAAGLRALGLERGDRVLIYLEKRLETVVALFAASAAGLVVVPVNPLLKAGQVGFIAGDCTARAVLTSPERLQTVREDLPGSVAHVVVVGSRAETGDHDGATAVTAWTELCQMAEPESQSPVTVVDADIAAILYTSGSTGTPKGVVLSHRNLLAGAESVAGYLGHTADDVVLSVLPLSFDAGLSQVTTALHAGAHVVLVNFLLAREVVRLCAKHRVTALTCVPPLWMQLAEADWPEESAAHLRYFANTGGHLPRTTLDRLREVFPKADPFLMYGLTEAFRSTYLDPAEIDRRPDSIGKAIPNAEVLVVRPDGTPCAAGEEGEIVHRGALVALGYWNDPERTAERYRSLPRAAGAAREETAVWSGDRAVRDEDGFLYFRGRADEMIKTSGYRVSPTEVEQAAHATGLVAEAAAFGVPDEALGQHIVLFAAPVPDTGADPAPLLAALRTALPTYMLPRRIAFLDRLPRSANGKFDRALLRERTSQVESEDEMGLT
ncbi:acyl-CoA ligase (AMP-forming), exosortase system type 1 associated [Catenulispora acidiphila DSM 44928]|uniref:Acyl-CoA ligase (AMP-forming), exosortase system type 1 associated n=1 Tax=Catenulispora acidiphila (strain DSM 44928 / JCM 14897 / NBRC 102108 / NRRL B-24433 / ID139908) TaxID=479433 RepID=C7Q575_CATAD|nr:acyl-CoA ligase (AMP-forming), exosortase A system-associated [Catenulispora acidiphila]ACU75844.1 acyl-CoA ligase (AMP-forming), exosortase system type 1 associated [Catenulispora acidiphila DSM 44928]